MLSLTYLLFYSDKKGSYSYFILFFYLIESLTLNITFCLNLYGEDGVPKRME